MAGLKQHKRIALTQRLIIQTDIETGATDATNTYGERIPDWATYWSGYGEVHTGTSREVFRASQTIAVCTHVIRIRWDHISKTINERMRVVWDGTTLDITSAVDEENRHRWLMLVCNEAK